MIRRWRARRARRRLLSLLDRYGLGLDVVYGDERKVA
jgi:hypothetical protein